MKFLLVMAVLWASNAFATTTHFLEVRSLRFTATEALTLVVGAQVQGEEGQGTQLQVKGVVSRPAQVVEISPARSFGNVDLLTAYVQDTYCKREYVPAGVSEFNAGRNLTASLGDYVPAKLRIEISYYLPPIPGEVARPGDNRLRKKSLVCPNSMQE